MQRETSDAGCPEGGRRLLRIGGITPFSTVDWPGKLSCVVFVAGCPWRCPYCQNHALQQAAAGVLGEGELFDLLAVRQGLLDAVVFSGGEPLAQGGVVEVARQVRAMGFQVGLHTCGAYPGHLREMLPLLDWVGLDVKAPWAAYGRVTSAEGSGERVQESLDMLLAAGVAMEARTTWHPALLTPADIDLIARDLASRGVRSWAVQAYRSQGTTGELADETVYPSDVPDGLADLFETYEFRRA